MKPFKVPEINFSWRHDGQDHPPRDPYRSDWRVHHPPPPPALNPYSRCEGERRKGGRGRGEKNYACPISLFFWETPYAGKRSSWLVRHREVDWYLSINCKSILFRSGWECRVYYAMRKSKQFLNWPSGQDLLAVLKSTPLLPHAKMLLVPTRFFSLASRLCSGVFYVLSEQMWF